MGDLHNGKTRLASWKEIAAFFGTTERTVMRWEGERGLPVHRLPGHMRSRIYADIAELRAWMTGSPPAPAQAADRPPARRWKGWAAAGLIAAAAVAAPVAAPLLTRPAAAPHRVPDAARAHFLIATRNWQARTPDGLRRAIGEFGRALAIDPDFARAWASLATTWNLMPEYTDMPPRLAFQRAAAAARAALARDDGLAGAHAALAFASFYGDGDAGTARREFQAALDRDPDQPDIEHWYATFLMTTGAFEEARVHIDRAAALNPESRAIAADRAVILVRLDLPEAIRELRAQVARDPDYHSSHGYLSWAWRIAGNDRGFLDEAETSARLQGDEATLEMVRAARPALNRGGDEAMKRAILAVRLAQFARGATGANDVVQAYGALGDARAATAFLRQAIDRHDPTAVYPATDPVIAASVHADPGFRAQVARLGLDR